MSRARRPQLQWRLRWLSRAARRDRSLSRRAHLNPSRQLRQRHPRRLRQVKRDRECRAVVAVAEVEAEVVRGRERLRPHLQSPRKHPQ
jgi:hypothetical protein